MTWTPLLDRIGWKPRLHSPQLAPNAFGKACGLWLLASLSIFSAAADPLPDLGDHRCSAVRGKPITGDARTYCRRDGSGGLLVELRAGPATDGHKGKPVLRVPPSLLAQADPGAGKGASRIELSGGLAYNGSLVPQLWMLDAGHRLRVHLGNQLNGETDDSGEGRPVHATNLHTHGLIVPPAAHLLNPTGTEVSAVGDNIFACTAAAGFSSECSGLYALAPGFADKDSPPGTQMRYDIPIPHNHPEGLFWFHPHIHQVAAKQVGRGLSGLLWIADPSHPVTRYYQKARPGARKDADDAAFAGPTRFIALKDMFVDSLKSDPAHPGIARGSFRYPAKAVPMDCPGTPSEHLGGCGPAAGQNSAWLFTVNGKVYPDLRFDSRRGEIWNIANTSANASYTLALRITSGPAAGTLLPMQVLARDGIPIQQGKRGPTTSATEVVMMPASRASLFIAYPRDLNGAAFNARLETTGYRTGADASGAVDPNQGDVWPAVALMQVAFPALPKWRRLPDLIDVPVDGGARLRSAMEEVAEAGEDALRALAVQADMHQLHSMASPHQEHTLAPAADAPATLAAIASGAAISSPQTAPCPGGVARVLGADEAQLVVLDIGTDPLEKDPAKQANSVFKIAAGVMKKGQIPDRAALPSAVIDPVLADAEPFGRRPGPQICAQQGHGIETWVVANPWRDGQADPAHANQELHNFHLHQTKFRVVAAFSPDPGTNDKIQAGVNGLHDTYPVPSGGWIKLEVEWKPFQVGDLVYHCHILEHEDGGMMQHLRIVP